MITIWFHTIRALGKAHRCYIAAKSRTRAAQVLTCGHLTTETLKTSPSTPVGEGWAPAWITDEGVWVERACIPGETWDAWKAHQQPVEESACEKVADVAAAVYRLGDLHAAALAGSQASPAVAEVALCLIEAEASAQARVALDEDALEEYAEAMRAGAAFPPVVLFFDGVTHWLADGFHRLEAARQARRASLPADVRPGGLREAQLYAIGANATHGLRRTNADKRRAVEMLLADPEWSQWSDREIARRCGVSNQTVSNYRKSQAGVSKFDTPPEAPKEPQPQASAPEAATPEPVTPAPPVRELGREALAQAEDEAPADGPEGDGAAWGEDPEPEASAPAEHGEVARLRQQVEELKAQVDELRQLLRDGQADAEAVARILEADDRTAQALEEIKRAHALARATDEQLKQVQGRAAFLGQEAEKWKRIAEKAQERKEKRQGSPKPTTPEQAAGMVPAGPAWD